MSQRWRAVGNSVSDLTGLRLEPQTFRSRDERITARLLKTSNLGDALSEVALLKRISDGGLGAKPQAAQRFLVIFFEKKIAILMPMDHIL